MLELDSWIGEPSGSPDERAEFARETWSAKQVGDADTRGSRDTRGRVRVDGRRGAGTGSVGKKWWRLERLDQRRGRTEAESEQKTCSRAEDGWCYLGLGEMVSDTMT